MFVELLGSVWTSLYFSILRPMIKWLSHKITGKCELLRLIYQYPEGAERTKRIEKSLERSRLRELKRLIQQYDYDVEEAVHIVVQVKQILIEVHMEFEKSFRLCLYQICAYKRLLDEVETLRKIKYDSENSQHEKLLMEGNDPATDFRGMGLLALQQLLYFARNYHTLSQQCLSKSHHPKIGLSYAIVGVNITGVAHYLMKKKKLRSHFYNTKSTLPVQMTMEDFHQVYCYLFYEFDNFWYKEKPKTIMEFNSVKDKFQKKIISKLKQPGAKLFLEKPS